MRKTNVMLMLVFLMMTLIAVPGWAKIGTVAVDNTIGNPGELGWVLPL